MMYQGSQIVVLDVSEMMCGSCSASVKRILENQPNVESASVNLMTETAVAKVNSDNTNLGEILANKVTQAGFPAQASSPHNFHFFQYPHMQFFFFLSTFRRLSRVSSNN